jgi:hypothetical protein
MLQASAQAVDFKVGRYFGEGQVEQTLPKLPLVSPNTLNWRHLTKTGSLANGK